MESLIADLCDIAGAELRDGSAASPGLWPMRFFPVGVWLRLGPWAGGTPRFIGGAGIAGTGGVSWMREWTAMIGHDRLLEIIGARRCARRREG